MNVKELIEKLQNLPENAIVMVNKYNYEQNVEYCDKATTVEFEDWTGEKIVYIY